MRIPPASCRRHSCCRRSCVVATYNAAVLVRPLLLWPSGRPRQVQDGEIKVKPTELEINENSKTTTVTTGLTYDSRKHKKEFVEHN